MRPHITSRLAELQQLAAGVHTVCLTHQRFETQETPWGPLCPRCKQAAYIAADLCHDAAADRLRRYWESQPPAFSLARQPMFVLVRMIGPLRVRSLGWPDSE